MKLPFGKYRGREISKLPRSYLEWMQRSLKGTEFHRFGMAAEELLESDEIREEVETEDLEQQATEFLKDHGFDEHGDSC